jgi:ferric-dicitrate binding protein FerR (iron transport regulator)
LIFYHYYLCSYNYKTLEEKLNHINDDLLVKYLLNEANAEEQQQVEQWLHADESNLTSYNQIRKVWEESRQLAARSNVDENRAWERFQRRIHPAPVRRSKFAWMRIAAAAIVVLGIGLIAVWTLDNRVKEVARVAQADVVNDTLPDGSLVTLNKESVLSYPSKFKGNTRQVVLKGEAFFKVQPNKEKPFVVLAKDVRITVVGTSFNVKNIKGNVEVVVETGIVKVSIGKKTVELKPNEKVEVNTTDSVMSEARVNDQLYKYYRTKEFVCDSTPLWKLVQVINEAYHSNVIIGNPAIKDMTLTTTFHNESLEQVLNVISITFSIKVIKDGNTIILQ